MEDPLAAGFAVALVVVGVAIAFMDDGSVDFSKMQLGPDDASRGSPSSPAAADETDRGTTIGSGGPSGSLGSASTSGSPMLNPAQETGGTLALLESTFSNNATAANKTVTAGNAAPSGTNSDATADGAGQTSGDGEGSSGTSDSSGGGRVAKIAASGVKGRPTLPVNSRQPPTTSVAAQQLYNDTGAVQASVSGTYSSATTLTGGENAATIASGSLTLAPAAISTWNGGGAPSVNWSTGTNWVGGVAPTSSTTTDLVFAGTTNTGTAATPLNQNIATPFILNTITFSAGGGTFFLGGGSLRFDGASNTINQNSSSAESIANAIDPSNKTGNNTSTITLTGNGTGVVTLSGVISSGNGNRDYAITKSGTSTFVLSANNTYGGGTTVDGGTLLVNNTSGSGTGTGNVTLNNSGTTLGGTGTMTGTVTVNAGAKIAPGNGTSNTAILTTGALTLASTSNFQVDLNGTTVGTGYDQLRVATGGVTITGSNLVVTVGTTLSVGQTFTILSKVAAGAITGTFAQGSTVTSGNYVFSVDYSGGDGNDVVLTLVVPEPSTWIGGGLAFAALGLMQRRRFTRAFISLRPLILRLP